MNTNNLNNYQNIRAEHNENNQNKLDFNNIPNQFQTSNNYQVSEDDFNNRAKELIAQELLLQVERKTSSWFDKCSCNLTYKFIYKVFFKNILI